MSETYLVFTDEAGAYNKRPNEKFRHCHPFYIRSNVRFSADDYRLFQNELEELNKKYGIPVEEEIKWSDLWEIHKGKYRSEFLKSKSEDTLKGYYRRVFNRAVDKKSLEFIFTVTCVYTQSCYQAEEEVLKFHLQEAMQRVNMDAQPNGFSTIINQLIDLIYTKCKDNYAVINRPNKIFPNQNGTFCCIADLKADAGIDEAYKETALKIGLDLRKQLLDTRINIYGVEVMSFDDAINQMNNTLQSSWVDKSDFYKSILGLKGKADRRQDALINLYNKLHISSPIYSVNVSKCSQRLLNSALDYCSEELCKMIDGNDLSDILSNYDFATADDFETWISNLIRSIRSHD